ncbi:MAG: alkaline phosphatase D family protein [Deltaproteobacteria bacterium]|nr:alkaline phosphatase D family protein [Deltaproteobacteria bacterium]
MKREFSRREFLKLTAASLVGLPWLARASSESPAAVPDISAGFEKAGLPFGMIVGDVTPHGAIVWLGAYGETEVSVHYGTDPSLRTFQATSLVRVSETADFTAKIPIEGLESGTAYFYRAVVSGKSPSPISRFVTAPKPSETVSVRFAFSGDSREWFQPFAILDSVRLSRPDFFIHLGDTIYADRDWIATELGEFWAKYRANRKDPPTRRLLAETSLYVIWDDHEVENDYYGEHPLAKIGQKAFFDYWPVRQDPGDPYRLYRSFRWGKAAEIFLLDTRQHRRPGEGTMLGQKQKEWLLRGLSSSDAWFKFIATSVPFTAPGSDRWGGYPKERREILKFIGEQNIPGVVFIAADVHYAAVSRVPESRGLREVMVGPIAAPLNWLARGTAERFEFFSSRTYSYGLVSIDGKGKPPVAEVSILDELNRPLYKTKVDLSPGDG